MKKNKLLKINIFILVFMLLFGVGTVFCAGQQPIAKVYADSTEQLQIENNGMTISNELWVALYNAYKNVTGELPAGDVLTLDMFANLPEGTPKILNLSTNTQGQSYGISSISGLADFDLTYFTTVNLSGNKITTFGDELKNLINLKKLDLSNNFIGSFSTSMLNNSCLATLEILDLSGNNLDACDLTGLQAANIDLSSNYLTDGSVTYPQEDLVINLNNNYIYTPSAERTNTAYGYQGAKNNQNFEKTTDILFAPNSNLEFTKIEIYENDELYDTLIENEKITLPVGNYTLKFLNSGNIEVQTSISFKVMLPKVTAKLFINGEEVEFTSKLTQDAVIKFYGEDGAEIYVSSNKITDTLNTTELKITQNGTIVITAYQTKDGYSSNASSFYFEVRKPTIGSWLIVGAGVIAIIALYFLLKFVLNKIMSSTLKGSKGNIKGKLD